MANRADICLVVEGSYPYVTGGVSSWLQWLMENLEDYTFSIVALIAGERKEEERRYRFPENVVSYQEHVIFDYREIEKAAPLSLSEGRWAALSAHRDRRRYSEYSQLNRRPEKACESNGSARSYREVP